MILCNDSCESEQIERSEAKENKVSEPSERNKQKGDIINVYVSLPNIPIIIVLVGIFYIYIQRNNKSGIVKDTKKKESNKKF